MKRENIIKYGIPILSVVLVALLGSIFTSNGLDWLKTLNKPSNWLPSFIIPTVWSVIYSLFISYLIYVTKKDILDKKRFILLIINGILNVVWCLAFFTLRYILLGEIIIILNLIASILLILAIFKDNKIWGYILYIYPIWLCIATSLNLSIWILN